MKVCDPAVIIMKQGVCNKCGYGPFCERQKCENSETPFLLILVKCQGSDGMCSLPVTHVKDIEP